MNDESERGIIGSILIDMGGRSYDLAVSAGITPEVFTNGMNAELFRTFMEMNKKGIPIDTIGVMETLRKNGQLENAGGAKHLQELIDSTPTSAHIEYYIAITADKYLLRKESDTAKKLIQEVSEENKSGEMLRSEYELAFAKMNTISLKNRRTIKDIARKATQDWIDNAEGKGSIGIQTGIKWLDEATAGILRGSYWVISGRPGSCKSTLCRMIAETVAEKGANVTIKTTEQTEEQYVGAMIAARAKIPVHRLNSPNFPTEKLHFVEDARDEIEKWPIFIDGEMCNRSQLSSWYTASVAKGSQLQILDYLQDVLPETKEDLKNQEQKISLATQEMRRCSKVTGVPIIIVSTESNQGELRYSGQIEYDASLWIRMSKAEDFEPKTNPKYYAEIKKSRFAESGKKLDLYYSYGKLLQKYEWQNQIAIMKGLYVPQEQPEEEDDECKKQAADEEYFPQPAGQHITPMMINAQSSSDESIPF